MCVEIAKSLSVCDFSEIGKLKESARTGITMDRAEFWRAVLRAHHSGTYYPSEHLSWVSSRTAALVEQRRPADADAVFAEHFLGGVSDLV